MTSATTPAPDTVPDSTSARDDATPTIRIAMPISIRSLALAVLAVFATIYMVRQMRDVLVPLALSALVYHLLAPFVYRLVKWRVPRVIASCVVMAALVAACGTAVWSLTDEAVAVVRQLPEAARSLRTAVRNYSGQSGDSITEKVQTAAKELESTANEAMGAQAPPRGVTRVQVEQPMVRGSDVLLGGARNLVVFGGSLVLVLVCALFMLISADRLKRIVVEIAGPTLTKKKVTVQIMDEIARQIQRFLVVQLVTSTLVAIVTGFALWWLGLEHPAVWGIVTGVLNTVPYFGPLLATIGLTGVSLLQFGTLQMAAVVAGTSLVITSLEGFFLTPWLLGRSAQMNQVAVFVAVLFWSWIWGPLGLLLAVPLTTMLKVICDHVEELQPVGKLMGE
jgi:predicted PurR-regulated permease PerM